MRTSTIQPPLGTQINANHPLSKGLVGSWLLNEGGGQIARDSTRLNGTNGVLTNGPFYKQSARGNGVLFDGVNDLITIPNSGPLSITQNITLSAWIYPVSLNAVTGIMQVVMKNNANSSFYGFNVTGATLHIQFQLATTGFNSTGVVALNKWYHICCTRNIGLASANSKIYINGVQDVTTGNNTTAINTSTASLSIGVDAVNANRGINAIIQDVKIYNRPLSDTEVMQLYTSPYSMFVGKTK